MNNQQDLAEFVRILGRGPARARHLTLDEARAAMVLILSGHAAPEAIGAMLMLMRYRGESAEEVAGFVQAARATLIGWGQIQVSLDWPSYAAGRSRGLPWFLLAAKLVAGAGIRVLLHGWNSHQQSAADVRTALPDVGIDIGHSPASIDAILANKNIAYVPLESLSPKLFDILHLRQVLGLRSPINTVLRLLNPCLADTSVQGVFHPTYRRLQQQTAQILGQNRSIILKGGGGEFERHPAKTIELFGLNKGNTFSCNYPASLAEKRRLADVTPDPKHLSQLWAGTYQDPFAEAIVKGTTAMALYACGYKDSLVSCEQIADMLWHQRQ